jgi:hypothetical protein
MESGMANQSTESPSAPTGENPLRAAARSNALYFPYINLPKVDWTFHTLLYWDKLASIIPMDHLYDPQYLEPFMRDLVREGLVDQLFPGAYLWEMPAFTTSFEAYIRRRLMRVQRNTFRASARPEPRVKIHMEKMGDIPGVLTEFGVAEKVDGPWYAVDESVANLFMAYLATCLGALPAVNAAPVTHDTKYAAAFGDLRPNYARIDSIHKAKARTAIIRALLPRPAETVTLDQVLRFKERHAVLLPAFRLLVETRSAEIARIADAEERSQATQLFIQTCKQRAEEIASAMRPTWGKIAFGSLTPLFGAGLALHGADVGNLELYAGAALSFAGAAYQAISTVPGNREQLLRRPLAYVAHARRFSG